MDVLNKKREQKARDKKDSTDRASGTVDSKAGTVSFKYDDGKKSTAKGGKKTDKRTSKKFVAAKDFKQDADATKKRKVYQNKDGSAGQKNVGKSDSKDKTNSQQRRIKAKVSDLIKKLRINYNKLLMKKKELKQTNENKATLVQECIDSIGEKKKFEELIYKHDGCRILQAMIKHGSIKQKELIIDNLKEHIVQLMTQKYSNHLAQKAYYYSPKPEQKKYFRTQINQQISKLIVHQYASDVIEFIYASTSDNEKSRREMVQSFYGQYFILFKAQQQDVVDDGKDASQLNLKQFLEQKPMLKEKILDKIEGIIQKLVEKGMSRHSLVQAIIADYVFCQTDHEKIKWLAETMKEKLPTLLASKEGLQVACVLFNHLDAKDRKLVVKSVQEPLKEMTTNKIAHLFLVHILNNLDDTVISKKKILSDIMLTIDENINDKAFQTIFLGMINPKAKRYFSPEDIIAFEAHQEHTSSKKDAGVRRMELLKIITKPLETFFEEHMQFYLMDISKNPLLAKIFQSRIEIGDFKNSDAVDEMFRQIQKKETIDGKKGQILIGHPDIHRALKELVKFDAELKDSELEFSKTLASVMSKNLDECLQTRAAWIFVEFLEHENTKALVLSELKKDATMKKIKSLLSSDSMKGNKGLQTVLDKITKK